MTNNAELFIPPQESDLPDDGLPPLIPLCELQASVVTAYAAVLAQVAQRQSAAGEAQAAGLQVLLDRLSYDALWAVSEVSRKMAFKIRRQRYISQDVYDRWRELQGRARPRLGDFEKDALGQTLTHEHVLQRKGLRTAIKTLSDASSLAELLKGVVACVVTSAEHVRLERLKAIDGWERYRRAEPPVGVYDRLRKCWLVDRST